MELLATGAAFDAEPKTDAGKRTVTVPPHVLPVLAEHMSASAGPDRVFVGRDGRPMRVMRFTRRSTVQGEGWRAQVPVSRPEAHWPDPRRGDRRNDQGSDASARPYVPGCVVSLPHAVNGRDAEIPSALSNLAARGDGAKLPPSIVVKH